MKKREISIRVSKCDEVLFEKKDCNPQDIISSLSLFGDDGVRFYIAVDDVELSVSAEQN